MTEPRLRQIGKYQIQAELGRGGFGSVYRAYDPTVGRLVAIKVLTASGDRNLLSRFKNEAAAAGNLRHKNIVTIYDFGEHEGLPYIVMEFLEGEDLQQVISQRKPLTLLQKVSIMLQVADGLHCAHRSGVVHRDVKPGNIRLLSDGAVKIMDFGIARLVAGGSGGARITRQGHVIGTLLYMAPEQVRGGEVDFLCDIFAFGITYYELLSGTHPFQGSDPRTIFYRITSEDPEPIRNLVPECPEALEEILNRTLHKERELRYQSLREVQLDTEPLLIELRQERATRLLSEANRLYGGGQLDSAQAVLSEAFDLDPGNRDARQLRETIQSKLLRRVIEPKIEALLKKAETQIAERQFQEAIASYEAALRLDRDNAEVKDQLDRARELLNISRESARMVAEAKREFSRNNLEATLQTLPEMLELDPGNPDARQLLQEVREELKRRERETLHQKTMLRAKELLQANRFDEALRELNSLDEGDSGREEAAKLSAQIKEKKLARERQQKYSEELASARELLTGGQYETAIPRLERLMNKYPEEPEATKLFIAAHKKLAAQRKGETLQNLGTELTRLVEARQFDRALAAVNEALREYPAEQRLLDALREIEAEQEKYRYTEAIRELVEKAQENVAQGLPEAAVHMLEAAIEAHPREERLTGDLAAVRIVAARKQRDHAIDALCREADGQLERREFDRAASAIGQGLRTHGEDPRLAGAREKIVHAKSQWERSEAVRHALEGSAQSLAAHDPDSAVAALEAASGRYPDDSQLLDALAKARDAAAEKQREDAIEQVCREADGRLQDGEFDKALACVEQALQPFADEARLTRLRDRIVSAKAEWERAETIRQALEDLANDNPERALQSLEVALRRYPRDEQLSDADMQARQALSRKQREQAIQIALRQASSDSANQEFDRAVAVVDQAIDSHGTDQRLTALLDRIVHAKADWERDQHVRKALHDSEQRLSAGDPADAIGVLEAAIERYPHEERLSQAVSGARRALESLRRETSIQELCGDLGAQLERGEFDRALEALQQGAESFGEDHRLTELRRRIVSARDERRRAESVRSALEQSTRYLSEGDPEAALQTLETALAQFRDEPQLETAREATKQVLETRRRDSAIEAARRDAVSKLERCEFDRAIAALDQAIEANGPDERLTALLDRVTVAKGAWDREETIKQAVAESKRRLSQGDPDGALQVAQAALAQYSDVEDLVSAAASAREALETKRRNAAIEGVCRSAGDKTERQEFDEALDEIGHGIAEFGGDERLVLLQQRTAAAKADWQRQEDIRAALQDCEHSVAKGEPEAALRLLEKALREYPEEASLAAAVSRAQQALDARNRARAIQKAATNVRRLLKNRQLDKALVAVEQELGRYPDDPVLTELRDEVAAAEEERNREKNVRRALSQAAELQGRNRVEDALQALRQALEKYPGEPRLSTAYREIEGESTAEAQAASLRATLEQAQQLLEQDADEATRSLEAALAEHPNDPRVIAALESAKRFRQSKQREASIDAVFLETQRFLESREFAPALDTIEKGVQDFGDEQRLAQMRETVLASKADFERAEGIRQAVEEAGRYGAQGQLETAVHSLLTATQIFGPADQLTEALTATKTAIEKKQRQEEIERLCRQAQAEVDAQRLDNAARLLNEAERLHGAAPEFAALHRNLDAANARWERAEAVNQAIQEINGWIAQGALDQAVQAGDAALARFSGEPEIVATRARAVQARKAKRRDEAVERVCDESRAILNHKDFKAALKMINQGQKTHGADPRFEQLRTEVATGKAAAERRNPAARFPVVTPVPGPGPAATVAAAPIVPAPGPQKNPRVLRIAAGILLIAAAAGFWLSGFGRTAKTVRLQVKASPSNAGVKVESQTCTKGDCSFDLKPGVYQVQISADGYQSRTEEARLTLGTAAPEIVVALKPLTPTVQVAANFVQGQVSLDGRTIGHLLDGQFALENLRPGKHELRISGSDYAATVAFETQFAKVPVLGGITVDGVDAIALGSFANEAAVSCSGCSGMSFVDGLPRREIKNGVLTIDSLSAGTHQLRLNSDSGERSMVFVAGGAPSVNLALTSNRNYGTLVVDTGEDGVSVFIDGQRYSRTTVRGQLRTPVAAREHIVRVVKDGLRAEPAEFHGAVAKGGQLEAHFKLTPVAARLLVANGVPGTSVGVDGRVVGTVAPDGSFSTQVPPGKHQIEFAREGFTPSQVPIDFSAGRTVQLSAEVRLTPLPQPKASTKAAPKAAPAEPPRPDPAAGELVDWQRVVRNPSVADVEEFLQKHPGGANAPEAQRLLERLEWNATNRNSKTALQQFLSRHAEGAHTQEANSLLAAIEKLEADELAAAQRAKEQAMRTSNDVQAVSGILKTFEDAYNRRDLGELQRLWNPMPKSTVDSYRNQFRDAKTLAFHIKPTGTPSLNGDTVTAVCIRTLSFTARSGERPPETNERVRITLERTGSTWAIRSITAF